MQRLLVELWSDLACPWCYVGKRRLEAALARFPQRAQVDVHWRAFELDPSAPRVQEPRLPYAERLARKYATSPARAEEMIARMTATAAADGLDFRFDRIRPGNTFDAHRLVRFAAEQGHMDAAEERLFRAYLTEGEAIGEHETLVRLARELGLDADATRAMLAGDAHASDVRADEDEAQARGIGAVPHFLVGDHTALAGAQPAEVLLQALHRAWEELVPAPASDASASGEACGPDGCAEPRASQMRD